MHDAPPVRHRRRTRLPFLTPAEVAVLLRVSPETVSKWAKQGRLDGVRTPGGRWRFRREVIAAFLAQQ
ncbi:helix-turn-helix domain-containing protein [Actinomadura yumaensis]|uniref:helix-turn-helix domain-containing protein n=1 Tax=Actinomadura yumaensis TaxID=111807 RepID=UPI00360FDF50